MLILGRRLSSGFTPLRSCHRYRQPVPLRDLFHCPLVPCATRLFPSSVRVTTPWLIGTACLCIGPTIRYFAIRELGKFFTWELTIKKDQHLVTTGPYSVVRHPAYFGNLFMLTGTFLTQIGPGSWFREAGWFDTVWGKVVAAVWFANIVWVPATMLVRLHTEDAILRQHYPEEWAAWAKKTPYKIIPYVF
ncbi:hypothetical protein BC629DRAFT_746113 [Irpex lacteus]|nr:hypothetical protein BC629DRAFT_746113 [Irpex lacteus]